MIIEYRKFRMSGKTHQTRSICIPKSISDELNLKKGDYMEMILDKDVIKIRKCKKSDSINEIENDIKKSFF